MVDYEPVRPRRRVAAAIADGAPAVWAERPDNLCFVHELGDGERRDGVRLRGARDAGPRTQPAPGRQSARAARLRRRVRAERRALPPHHLDREPAPHPPAAGRAPLSGRPRTASTSSRATSAAASAPRAVSTPRRSLVLWAAQRLGRPIKWIADRSESFLADFNGRDQLADAELALDPSALILGLRVDDESQPRLPARALQRAPAADRGADALQRVCDSRDARNRPRRADAHAHADHLSRGRPARGDLSRRARRSIRPRRSSASSRSSSAGGTSSRDLPYRTAVGETYDSGEFEAILDAARALADWDGFTARRKATEARGLLRGPRPRDVHRSLRDRLGSHGDPLRPHRRRERRRRHLLLRTGPRDDVRADARRLARPPARADPRHPGRHRPDGVRARQLRLAHGDRRRLGAARRRGRDHREREARRRASSSRPARRTSRSSDGRFVVAGTDRSVTLQDAARATYPWGAKLPPELASGLEGIGHWSATPQNYPNGCYVVEVEVDPETGVVRLDRIAGDRRRRPHDQPVAA